jgi:RNA polymerase sigma factor (sigma-70 family)
VDLVGFESCFDAHFVVVHRFIARRVGTALADDLAAETFTTAFRRRRDFDSGFGSSRSWLFGIAANLLRSHWRTEQRLLELDARLRADCEPHQDLSRNDEQLTASHVSPRMAAALASLAADQREVLLLHAWAELSHEEIAAALRIAPGTVRSRLSRARAALRQQLAGLDFDLRVLEEAGAVPARRGTDHG